MYLVQVCKRLYVHNCVQYLRVVHCATLVNSDNGKMHWKGIISETDNLFASNNSIGTFLALQYCMLFDTMCFVAP
jgi:hypothetical protein